MEKKLPNKSPIKPWQSWLIKGFAAFSVLNGGFLLSKKLLHFAENGAQNSLYTFIKIISPINYLALGVALLLVKFEYFEDIIDSNVLSLLIIFILFIGLVREINFPSIGLGHPFNICLYAGVLIFFMFSKWQMLRKEMQ